MTFHIFHNPMQSLDFSGAGGSDTESHPSIWRWTESLHQQPNTKRKTTDMIGYWMVWYWNFEPVEHSLIFM
jgi:hypothetical protein